MSSDRSLRADAGIGAVIRNKCAMCIKNWVHSISVGIHLTDGYIISYERRRVPAHRREREDWVDHFISARRGGRRSDLLKKTAIIYRLVRIASKARFEWREVSAVREQQSRRPISATRDDPRSWGMSREARGKHDHKMQCFGK